MTVTEIIKGLRDHAEGDGAYPTHYDAGATMDYQFYSLEMIVRDCLWGYRTVAVRLLRAIADENNQ